MTTRPIRTTTTPTTPLNSPRITTPGNRDLLNRIPLPSMYRTTPLNPTTMLIMVLPLTPFRIQPRPSGTVRRGLRSVSPWLHRRPCNKRHPFLLPSADRNLRQYLHLHLRLHQHQHQHQHPLPSAYMLIPPSHSPTRRRGEPQGHPRPPPICLPNPSVSRGRKKSPFLGIPHRWRRHLRWILISGRHALFFLIFRS
jgi:hypothetical protein